MKTRQIISMFILVLVIATATVFAQKPAEPNKLQTITTEMLKAKMDNSVKQNRSLLVFFWTGSCPYCPDAMPSIKSAYKSYVSKGVDFLLVSLDDRKSYKSAVDFLESQQIEMPVYWLDQQTNLSWIDQHEKKILPLQDVIKTEVKAFPRALLYDAKGKIVLDQNESFDVDELVAKLNVLASKKPAKQLAKSSVH